MKELSLKMLGPNEFTGRTFVNIRTLVLLWFNVFYFITHLYMFIITKPTRSYARTHSEKQYMMRLHMKRCKLLLNVKNDHC